MQVIKNIFYGLLENANYYGIFLLMFLAVFMMVLAIAFIIKGRQSNTRERLGKLIGSEASNPTTGAPSRLMGHNDDTIAARLSKPLHKISSINKRNVRQKMQLTLVRAGYRSDQAIYNYLTAKIVCPFIYAAIFMVTRMVYNFQTQVLMSILALLALGYFTPNLWVFLMTKTRQEKLVKGLPDALDLMVVCVESGLGLDMTFKRVGDEMLPLCKELSDEFTLTTLEIRAGISRADAFKNMNVRTGVPQINSLTTLLAQTSRFGTSLATALRVHADSMRIKRRQIAEATAAKSAVKMVFPLVLCIFPAIFVVLVGPGAIQIIKYLIPALGGGG